MATSAPPRPHHHLMPVLITALAIALFSLMDGMMKAASLISGVHAALFLRSVIGTAMLGPVWRLRGGHWPLAAAMRLHVWRGLVAAGMAATFFYGIMLMPLAEAIALSFIAPLLAIFLAAATLGEPVRRASVVAAVFGLAGAVVIALGRIHAARYGPEALLGIGAVLISALLYAVNIVLQRKQAQVAGPLEVALFQNAVMAVVLGALVLVRLPFGATLSALLLPAGPAMPLVAGAALLTSASLMLLAWAYARAEAQVLVSLEYTAFGWSALIGWLWFGEIVTGTTLAGLALILAGVWLGSRSSPAANPEFPLPPG